MGYQLHPAIALGAKISLESITPTNLPPGSSLLACVFAILHPNISLRGISTMVLSLNSIVSCIWPCYKIFLYPLSIIHFFTAT